MQIKDNQRHLGQIGNGTLHLLRIKTSCRRILPAKWNEMGMKLGILKITVNQEFSHSELDLVVQRMSHPATGRWKNNRKDSKEKGTDLKRDKHWLCKLVSLARERRAVAPRNAICMLGRVIIRQGS